MSSFLVFSSGTLLSQANVEILRSNIYGFGETKVAADRAAVTKIILIQDGYWERAPQTKTATGCLTNVDFFPEALFRKTIGVLIQDGSLDWPRRLKPPLAV